MMSPPGPPPADATLDELASAWLAGDSAAETRLFEDLRVSFAALAKQRVQRDQVDDVVQDALAIVLSKGRQTERKENVLVWSLTILRNVIGNHYQARGREKERMIQGEDTLQHIADAEAVVDDSELETILGRALKRLAEQFPRCGKIFASILRSHELGGGQREISQRALEYVQSDDPGLSRGTFYTTLHRCRSRLKILLTEAEGYGRA